MSDNTPENIPEQLSEPVVDQAGEEIGSSAEITPIEPLRAPDAAIAQPEAKQPERKQGARSVFIAIAAWIIPGLGHFVQRRIGRAIAGFAAVGTMAIMGLWMRGNVFPAQSGDAFSVLGFIADAGSGIFYFLAHTIETAGPDVSRAAGDYGTRLIATAGVLNMLFVLDALEISRGHKN
jgi:hypothetical protein